MRARLKVCCIMSPAEAALAVEAGASALGLVSQMPSGPGVIDDGLIAEIAAAVPPPVATFLLTCRRDAAGIVEQARACGTGTLQLVDAVAPEVYGEIRTALPAVKLVQVIHVRGAESVAEARAVAPHVDALLLDSGNPDLATKQLGGTGRVHDWAHSRAIVETAGKPVFLAGGIRPDNVAAALDAVRPFGIDLCSGVRSHGALDADKLAALVAAMR